MQDNPITPVPAHSPHTSPSTHVRRSKLRLRLEELFPPLSPPSRQRWLAVVGVTVVAIAAAGLFLWLRSSNSPIGGGDQPTGIPIQTTDNGDSTDSEDTTLPSTDEGEGEATDTTSPAEPDEDATSGDTTAAEHPTNPDETVGDPPPDTASQTTSSPSPEDSSPPSDTFPEETVPTIPEGCLGYASLDMSDPALGVGYIQNGDSFLPSSLPADSPWASANPTVLIVNTQPYEGYGGGRPWYDPATGGLALTESPNHPEGVVALGTELARSLRSHGVTVIHLRLSVAEGESTASVFTRTEEAIRYYLRLYPDIGLVVDLRRSAELTAEGDILATKGDYNGDPCAQLRITVSRGRDEEALGYDMAVALAIRKALWNQSPTLSRPIRIKEGAGLAGEISDLRVLTLEMGSAGNTYGQARATVEPLGAAISEIIKKYS